MVFHVFLKAFSRVVPPFARPKSFRKSGYEDLTSMAEQISAALPTPPPSEELDSGKQKIVEHVEAEEPKIIEHTEPERTEEISGVTSEMHAESVPEELDETIETENGGTYELPERFFESPMEPLVVKLPKEAYSAKATEDKAFILNDGRKLLSLNDLLNALSDMDDFVFYHHVTEHRNDFASWIRDVHKEEALAKLVASRKHKADMAKALEPHPDL